MLSSGNSHARSRGILMPHSADISGYPLDPELRKLEFQLGDLAELWRGSFGDDNRQSQLVDEYHSILTRLYHLGWDSELDIESELPDRLMPQEYLRRNFPRPTNPFHRRKEQ